MLDSWQTGIVGILLAAAAAMWPALKKIRIPASVIPATTSDSYDRAVWVNNLFDLAAAADVRSEASVAAASRSLIAALVAGKDKEKAA
jgi:hypothetical protein